MYKLIILFVLSLIFNSCNLKNFNDSYNTELSPKSLVAVKQLASYVPRDDYDKLPIPNFKVNKQVNKNIDYFKNKDKQFINEALGRRNLFLPRIYEIFDYYGVPRVFAEIALIESRYDRLAVSPSKAVGLWQFMKPTARELGLKVNALEDERKDLVLSTAAAAKMLRKLFLEFQNWELVLASYNAGQTRVRKSIRKSGTRDFYKLAQKGYFRKETNNYVPKFVAALIILRENGDL